MSFDTIQGFKPLLRQIRQVDITGYGEVVIHPDFDRIVAWLTELGTPFRFVTNGSMLTPERVDLLMNSSLEEIVISLNSLNPETYKYLSYGEAGLLKNRINLNRVLNNIVYLKQANVQNKRIYISFVVTSKNFDELMSFIDFGAEYGFPLSFQGLAISLNDKYPTGLHIPDTQENRSYLERVKAYAHQRGVPLSCFSFDTQHQSGQPVDEISLKKPSKHAIGFTPNHSFRNQAMLSHVVGGAVITPSATSMNRISKLSGTASCITT